jgi:chemotaxis protein histidine kinase CheA
MPDLSPRDAAIEGQFEARLDIVRKRFSAKLMDRIRQLAGDLAQMVGDGAEPAELVANAYRWLHETCGIASTIGFEAIGQAARSCDSLLVGPYRARRGLTRDELVDLTACLDSLQNAAQAEIRMELNRG